MSYHCVYPITLLFRFLIYGALGTVIGHELTHAFDDQGNGQLGFDDQGNGQLGFDDQGNDGWSHYATFLYVYG